MFQIYIQTRLKVWWSVLLRFVLQVIAVCLAVACGLSRVSDYRHHWSDVLAGFLIGTFIAGWLVSLISDGTDVTLFTPTLTPELSEFIH